MKIFITGTDTEIGKTYCAMSLLHGFNRLGLTTLGLKPVASGGFYLDGDFYNDDSIALQNVSSIKIPHHMITPFSFQAAIAPHIAAEHMQKFLTVEHINQQIKDSLAVSADICLIEGFGGWHAPLNHKETMADFVIANQFDVILVIGLRLGCLNHSILTYKAIKQSGLNIKGWIMNMINPEMMCIQENILSLYAWIPEPCLGVIHYQQDPKTAFKFNTNPFS